MLRIGDFSRLSQVTVKTLRYYDEIGLLTPSSVDRFTGYRYYSVDQLPRLNRILTLKDLGFSLEQIAQVLDEGITPEELRGMLRIRQAEIEGQLETERGRLERVAARLRQIEQEGIMAHDVVIKELEPVTVASVRGVLPAYSDVGKLFGEVFAYLGQRGVQPAGPPLAIYHDQEYRESNVDVEAVVPLATSLPGSERVSVREMPAVTVASVIHQGGYDTIGEAYTAAMSWIEGHGYRITGPGREVYLRGPESAGPPDTYVTDIQFPVEKD